MTWIGSVHRGTISLPTSLLHSLQFCVNEYYVEGVVGALHVVAFDLLLHYMSHHKDNRSRCLAR